MKAVGIKKALIWEKDKPQILLEILKKAGVENLVKNPPERVTQLIKSDSDIISNKVLLEEKFEAAF